MEVVLPAQVIRLVGEAHRLAGPVFDFVHRRTTFACGEEADRLTGRSVERGGAGEAGEGAMPYSQRE